MVGTGFCFGYGGIVPRTDREPVGARRPSFTSRHCEGTTSSCVGQEADKHKQRLLPLSRRLDAPRSCPCTRTTISRMSRIFTTSFASVYPHDVTKVERKGRTKAELDHVIQWLTGFDEPALGGHLAAGTTASTRTRP